MISNKTKYALKALSTLAQEYETRKPVLISELAKRDKIPKKFLEIILLGLKNRGILISKKGKGGGYLLAKNPDQIKLLTVMRILDGPVAPLPCLSQTAYQKCKECDDEATCSIRMVMKELYEAQLKFLGETSLRDIAAKACEAHSAEMYFI